MNLNSHTNSLAELTISVSTQLVEHRLFNISVIDRAVAQNYSSLTFNFYRERHIHEENRETIFIGASAKNGMPMALAVLQQSSNHQTLEILSLVVGKAFRGIGLAQEILQAIHTLAKLKNFTSLYCSFAEELASADKLRTLLHKGHWHEPVPFYDMHWCDTADCIERLGSKLCERMLDGASVKAFHDLSENEAAAFSKSIVGTDEEQWMIGLHNSPNKWPETVKGWLARNVHGEAIAWVLADYSQSDSVAYPILFVRNKFRKKMFGLGLLVYAWKKQLEHGRAFASGNIRCENTAMLNLISRRMGASIVKVKRVLQSHLELK